MTTPHADYARTLRELLPRVQDKLQWEARTGQTHPALVAEQISRFKACIHHHEQAAQAGAQAEARLEDAAHG